MICPNCSADAEFTQHDGRFGYDPDYQPWLTCDACGAPTDEAELQQLNQPATITAGDEGRLPWQHNLYRKPPGTSDSPRMCLNRLRSNMA